MMRDYVFGVLGLVGVSFWAFQGCSSDGATSNVASTGGTGGASDGGLDGSSGSSGSQSDAGAGMGGSSGSAGGSGSGGVGGSGGTAGAATGGSGGSAGTGGVAGTAGTGGVAGAAGTGGVAGAAGTGGVAGAAGTGGVAGTAGTGGTGGAGGGTGSQLVGLKGIDAFDALSAADKNTLKTTKIFFEHMSVGYNLLYGFDKWKPAGVGASSLGFTIGSVSSASDYDSKLTFGELAFTDDGIANGFALNKISGFQNRLTGGGIGAKVKVAGFKFCYNDITADNTTDGGSSIMAAYESTMKTLLSTYPNLSFFHITTPLQPANEYNSVQSNTIRRKIAEWQKTKFTSGRHVLFDLQTVESTNSNGTVCTQSGIPVLCPEWTGDKNGHLNDAGSTRAAKAWLYSLHVARGL